MDHSIPVIAIDGPSGSGKGTLAQAVASQLGWHFLDSGALYRIVGAMCRRQTVDLDNPAAVAQLATVLSISFAQGKVQVDGLDLTDEIRTEDAGVDASKVAAHPPVRDAVLDLIEQAALPVWWEERPSVLVWIVLQEGGQRRILTGADKHPLVNALNQQADRRGLRVQLPMMDLQDALAISAADVWGRVSTTIDRAGVRYAPEVTVVGRFNVQAELGITRYAGQWEVWGDATNAVNTASAEVNNEDVDSAGKLGVNALAQMLTEQYAVLPRGQRQTRIQVSNVQSAGDYASLLRYLDGLTFVRQVDIDQVQGDNLLLRLHGQAEQAQLEFLLTRQKKLKRNWSFC